MKYVISWIARDGLDEQADARSLQVFEKWSPSPGVTFEQFLGRVDARGGYAVVTTDDPQLVARDMAIFGAWFDMEVTPVLEIADTARISGEAIEFRSSIV